MFTKPGLTGNVNASPLFKLVFSLLYCINFLQRYLCMCQCNLSTVFSKLASRLEKVVQKNLYVSLQKKKPKPNKTLQVGSWDEA